MEAFVVELDVATSYDVWRERYVGSAVVDEHLATMFCHYGVVPVGIPIVSPIATMDTTKGVLVS